MLTKKEVQELKELYSLYYQSGCWGTKDILRMLKLEKGASDGQLKRLLKRHDKTLEGEFE